MKFYDETFITGLTVQAPIGVYDFEKEILQPLIFDVILYKDTSKAGETDDVQFCIDYTLVKKAIEDFIKKEHIELIETVANRLATILIEQFNLDGAKIKVCKPTGLTDVTSVGVCITRFRK